MISWVLATPLDLIGHVDGGGDAAISVRSTALRIDFTDPRLLHFDTDTRAPQFRELAAAIDGTSRTTRSWVLHESGFTSGAGLTATPARDCGVQFVRLVVAAPVAHLVVRMAPGSFASRVSRELTAAGAVEKGG